MAHPYPQHPVTFRRAEVLDPVQKACVSTRAYLGVAELADLARLHPAAELLRHRLHSVADPEHGHAELEHRGRRLVGGFPVRREVAAGKDYALGAESAHEGVGYVAGMDLAIDFRLAHAARDELRVLRTEIEDENLLVLRGQVRGLGSGLEQTRRAPHAGFLLPGPS